MINQSIVFGFGPFSAAISGFEAKVSVIYRVGEVEHSFFPVKASLVQPERSRAPWNPFSMWKYSNNARP